MAQQLLSIVTSVEVRCVEGSQLVPLGSVISPEHKKVKDSEAACFPTLGVLVILLWEAHLGCDVKVAIYGYRPLPFQSSESEV